MTSFQPLTINEDFNSTSSPSPANISNTSSAPSTNFNDVYNLGPEIGRGKFSSVRVAKHKQSLTDVAVKIIDVSKFTNSLIANPEDLKRETKICSLLKHRNIVELLEVYTIGTGIYMVFELMEGKDLLSEIIRRVNANYVYSDAVASHYMSQILDAAQACHDMNIVHRDIQPANILFQGKDNASEVKLASFSAASAIGDTNFETPSLEFSDIYFLSPEAIHDSRMRT